MEKIGRIKAFTWMLGQKSELPIVTDYQLGVILFQLYKTKTVAGQSVNITKDLPTSGDLTTIRNKLIDTGVLDTAKGQYGNAYRVLGHQSASAEDIICVLDPFAYISHLSAMDFHGLTDRLPKTAFITTLTPPEWRVAAQKRMEKDFGDDLQDYVNAGLPHLVNTTVNSIDRKTVSRFTTKHPGGYRVIKGRPMRVATIGRTFLDMLRRPDLSGGINHVIEVYQEHAKKYLRLIIDELDRHGSKIERVRAGYILEEKCGIRDDRISAWTRDAQRGGSRKLDPDAEYSPDYSERWCLSINNIGA